MKSALVVLAIAAAAAAVVSAELFTNKEKEGHFYELRPRLGHFKEGPLFMNLYSIYVTKFIQGKTHEKRDSDDYRNYLPSGDECVNFFRRFRIDDYQVTELEDLVVLDACLGYLYESKFHEKDSEQSTTLAEELPELMADQKLKDLYDGSRVEHLPEDAKKCVANTVYNNMLGRAELDGQCNNHMLQLFLQFAECHETIPADQRTTDTYLRIIYEFVKTRGHECFMTEINNLNSAVRGKYDNNPFAKLSESIRGSFSSLSAQMKERMWPKEFKELLKAIQNTKEQINLTHIHKLIRGVLTGDKPLTEAFLNNMALYATKRINHEGGKKKVQKDPTQGRKIYEGYVDSLCNFFRVADRKKDYDFATAMTRLVRVLAHEDIFAISKDYFLNNVLRSSYETAVLYLSISGCNILTFTEGTVVTKAFVGKPTFKIGFRRDTSAMIQWPDAGFY